MNKRVRRLVSSFLIMVMFGISLAASLAAQPAYAITVGECKDKYGIDGSTRIPPGTELSPEEEECVRIVAEDLNEQEENNRNQDRLQAVKQAMNAIGSRKEAQLAFFGESNESDPGGIDKLDINAGQDGEPSDFKARDTAALGSKYDGNPYFYVHSKHLIHNPNGEGTAVGHDDVRFIRFVLTDIHNNSTGDVQEGTPFSGGGNQENIIYVFRNEFNPAINVSFKTNKGRLASGNDAFGADEMHFSFAASCAGTFSEDAWTSDIEWAGGLGDEKYFNGVALTDEADNPEAIDEVAERFNGINRCTTDNDFFAQALQKALETLKVAISEFFDFVKRALLNVTDTGTLTDNQGLVEAWKTIRDFVNLIFILIMVVIAFSNILRIDTDRYGVRALLPRLVFGVIAVNFSFILVQILTNIAFIIAQPFASKAFGLLANPPADGSIIDPQSGIGQVVIAVLMVIGVAIAMLILFIFLVVRILMIWLLTALSPFVFLFMILPLTRSLVSSWWKNAVKWIFMAPIAFMLLFVAAEIISNVGSRNQDINGPDFLLKIAFFIGAVIAAVMIPYKIGGEVMSRAAGGARAARKKGWGATKRGGGLAGKAIGATSAGQTAKQMLKQRGATKEKAAGRRATEARARIADTLGDSRLGQFLTGGEKADVAIARAGEVNEQANALKEAHYNRGTLEQIALGNEDGALTGDEARLAANPIQQEAAAKLLASRGEVYGMEEGGVGHRIFKKHAAAGLHTAMKEQNPALGYADHNGNWDARALENVTGFTGALEPTASKDIYWSDVDKMAWHSTKPDESAAGHAVVKGLQPAQVRANLDRNNPRTYISNDDERGHFENLVKNSGRSDLIEAAKEAKAKNKPPQP